MTRRGASLLCGLITLMAGAPVASGQMAAPAAPPVLIASPPAAPGVIEGSPVVRGHFERFNDKFHDKFAGWPENFNEPPLGHYKSQIFGQQVAKADAHRFQLYQSDFVGKTTTLSPSGAHRLTQMVVRLRCVDHPLLVEWSPDNPGLASARRSSIETLLKQAGQPLLASRVVVSPSPYPGLPGAEAANNNDTLILRNMDAARSFSRTPVPQATLIGSGGP